MAEEGWPTGPDHATSGLLHSALGTCYLLRGWMQVPEPERSLGAYLAKRTQHKKRREELKRERVLHAPSKKRGRVLNVSSFGRGAMLIKP